MKLDWQNTVTLIVAIITILGTSSLVGNFIFTQLTKPIIVVDIKDKNSNSVESENIQIEVSNHGISPATNLSLVIDPNTSIHSISNVISSANLSLIQPKVQNGLLLPKQDPTIIDYQFAILKTPVFAGGDGSIIDLEINIVKPNGRDYDLSNFNVYAVYDQGSKKGTQNASHDILLMSIQQIDRTYSSIFWLIVTGIIVIIIITIISRGMRRYRRRKWSNRISFKGIRPANNKGKPGDLCLNSNARAVGDAIGWIKVGGNINAWRPIGTV